LRLFFFILAVFFGLVACRHISTNTASLIASTAHIDSSKTALIQDSLPIHRPYDPSTGKKFGYGKFRTPDFPTDSFATLPSPDSYLKSFYGNGAKKYVHSTNGDKSVTIQNSFPKGGAYTDPNGKSFGYVIFWTRVINETTTPLELSISFPAAILPLPDSYFKLFLPPDTMTLDKVSLYDYGATGLKSFLDTGINYPTMLQRTINPKEDCVFYIGALFDHANGVARAELVLKEQDLFYRINLLDATIIPCGRIAFKKL
jgi:hypothetical protein